jgi:O-antigen/teichoic acid export membrane protein
VWVSLGRVLGQASGRFDRLLLGKIAPAHELGGYYMANRLTTTIPSMVTGILDQVLLPIYSSSNNDPAVVERGYWKGLRYSALLVMPLCLLIAPFARQIVWVAMGAKWLFIVPVAQILSISGAIQAIGGGIFASAVYASGMPRLNTLVNAFRVIVLPACVMAGSRWGIEGVAWGVTLFGIIGRLFNQWLLKRFLKYSFRRFIETIGLPLLANAITVAAGFAVSRLIALSAVLPVLGLTLLAGAGCLSLYLLVCRLTMPEDSRFLLDQLKRVAKAKLAKRRE